jgi:hypothetical protein
MASYLFSERASRRGVEERLAFLGNHFLNENETPELELEPVDVLLRASFRPVVRPTRTFNG